MWKTEWKYLVRQPLFWLCLIAMLMFTFVLSVGLRLEEVDVTRQALYLQIALTMLTLPILCAVLAPLILLRDHSSGMSELIAATPTTKNERDRAGIGVLIAAQLLIYFLCFAIFVMRIFYTFNAGVFGLSLSFLLGIVLPSVVLFSVFALWLVRRYINSIIVFIAFALLWFGYTSLSSMSGSPILAGSAVIHRYLFELMIWLDPYGITALSKSIIESGTINLETSLLLNRLFYIAIAAVVFLKIIRSKPRVQLEVSDSSARKTRDQLIEYDNNHTKSEQKNELKSNTCLNTSGIANFNTVTPQFGSKLKIYSLVNTSFSTLIRQYSTLIILIIWPILIFSEISSGINYVEPLSTLASDSIDALNQVVWDVVPFLGGLTLCLWAWQVSWRDKISSMDELIATSPVSTVILFISQYLTLVLMIFGLISLTAISSSVAEWITKSEWLWEHYLIQLSLSSLPLLLLAGIFLVINTICRRKLVAALLCVLVLFIKHSSLMDLLDLSHPLTNIASSPLQAPDHYWGYQSSFSSYWPFMGFWSLVVAIAGWIAVKHSHRGTARNILPSNFTQKGTWGLITSLIIVFSCMHFNLVSERPLINQSQRDLWRANYERDYLKWSSVAQPSINEIRSKIDLFPEQGRADLHWKIVLTNQKESEISDILVGGSLYHSYQNVRMEGGDLVHWDQELNQRVFRLKRPLLPGQNVVLTATMTYQQSALWPAGLHQIVTPQFTYLRGVPLIPTIGFNSQLRLRDKERREAVGLQALQSPAPSSALGKSDFERIPLTWVDLHSIISTPSGHFGIAQGELIKSWQIGQRSFFEYKTTQSIRNIPAWLSVPHQPKHQRVADTDIRLFDPGGSQSYPVHFNAMADTIKWFTSEISPYRSRVLNLISLPDMGVSGYALPQIGLINHKEGFRAFPKPGSGFDQRYRRTVHETAHQWFGHDIGHGIEEERAFLVESMAKYVELVLIEKRYGIQAMQSLVEYESHRYQLARSRSQSFPEVLIDARRSFTMYSGATLVFSELRNTVGDAVITTALKNLWAKQASTHLPVTSMDLIDALKAEAGANHYQDIERLFLKPMTN